MAIPVWEGHHHSQFLPLSGWGGSFWSRPVDPDRQKEPFGGDYIAIIHGLSEWGGHVADPFSSERHALEISLPLDDCRQAHGAFS